MMDLTWVKTLGYLVLIVSGQILEAPESWASVCLRGYLGYVNCYGMSHFELWVEPFLDQGILDYLNGEIELCASKHSSLFPSYGCDMTSGFKHLDFPAKDYILNCELK